MKKVVCYQLEFGNNFADVSTESSSPDDNLEYSVETSDKVIFQTEAGNRQYILQARDLPNCITYQPSLTNHLLLLSFLYSSYIGERLPESCTQHYTHSVTGS